MSLVADIHPFVVGVDTHARHHVYTILNPTGVLIDARDFPTSPAGINRALVWAAHRTQAHADTLWVIEGADSYGALLTGTVAAHGYPLAEALWIEAKRHHGRGKSDTFDARRIATAVLALPVSKLRRPRLNNGVRQALQVFVTARSAMTKDRTRAVNAVTALVRRHAPGVDARKALRGAQISDIARWRARKEELTVSVARAEAIRLAKYIVTLDDQLKDNDQQLTDLVTISEAAPLLQEPGFGAVSAAKCLVAWSHHGRVQTEAEFAALAGVNPIPASSGNTTRHRLNRGGDRPLNSALHMVAIVKLTHDQETKAYVAKSQAEGKTTKEIIRCLKRYLARRVFRILNAQHPTSQPA